MFSKIIVLGALLAGYSMVAYAQVGVCPAGTIPNGTQASAMECAPDPNYNEQSAQPAPQPPPPLWADEWGAVAIPIHGSASAFGAVTDMPTKGAAVAAALTKCEAAPNTRCAIDQTYVNQCIAVTSGSKYLPTSTAATLTLAKSLSMKLCLERDTNCVPYYSACSYPVRIQ